MSWADQRPTYRDAQPAIIEAALRRSQRRPTGNWYAFAASDRVPGGHRSARASRASTSSPGATNRPAARRAAQLSAFGRRPCHRHRAPGELICRWHGLTLDGAAREFGWSPLPSHDDGVLAWVRLDAGRGETAGSAGDSATADRRHAERGRPHGRRVRAEDIIANRLDPWHGAWFHPYSFTRLDVLDDTHRRQVDRFLVDGDFPDGPRWACPSSRSSVARTHAPSSCASSDGEGTGSVVETHATPMGSGPDGRPRTAVLEATIAHSDRPGFKRASRVAPLITPLMRYAATKLWRDDLAYAERRYQVRGDRVARPNRLRVQEFQRDISCRPAGSAMRRSLAFTAARTHGVYSPPGAPSRAP